MGTSLRYLELEEKSERKVGEEEYLRVEMFWRVLVRI
jgi:hypothetical protein